jgi:hypothetical protein
LGLAEVQEAVLYLQLPWRRLLVVSETSLGEFHEILQSAFGWSGEHLHRFLIHGVAYGIPHVGGIVFREDARGVPLSRFRLHCGERFRYEYDFTADCPRGRRG